MVVHNMPLESFLLHVEELLLVVDELREGFGVRVVWLTPVSRSLQKKGILAGE